MFYIDLIKQILTDLKMTDVDPRHVLAYMRLERHTLDGLSRAAFKRLATSCAHTAKADPALAESTAQSLGVR
jgi:hypothetical protein